MTKRPPPDTPIFRRIARHKANRANPLGYQAVRHVVMLRLLSFSIDFIWAITGIKRDDIKVILKEHGKMPRTRSGGFYWTRWYDVPGWRRKFLEIPVFVPRRAERAERANNLVAPAILDALGVQSIFDVELPKVPGAPDKGYRSDWKAESSRGVVSRGSRGAPPDSAD